MSNNTFFSFILGPIPFFFLGRSVYFLPWNNITGVSYHIFLNDIVSLQFPLGFVEEIFISLQFIVKFGHFLEG